MLTFPGLAKAETETVSTGAADAVTVSSQTTSPAPAASEATSSVKASTETASVANDDSNSDKATSGLSPSGDNIPSLPQAEKPQANQAPASEKPDVTEVSTEKAQAGDASQAEKDTKEKAAAGITDKEKTQSADPAQAKKDAEEKAAADITGKEKTQSGDTSQAKKDAKGKDATSRTGKEKTPSGDASQAEKKAIEKEAVSLTNKEKALAGDPAQAEEETIENKKETPATTDKEKTQARDASQAKEEKAKEDAASIADKEKPEAIDPTQVDAGLTENEDPSQLKNETAEALPSTKEAEVLEKGETLEVEALAKAPMALGAGAGNPQNIVEVTSFEGLKKAIEDAGNTPTTIKIMQSFTLTEALTIGKDQDITLTANNERKEEAWKSIDQPANHAKEGEAKQREIIAEGRKRGEAALEKADLEKNPLPEDKNDIIIKRADGFVDNTLFRVNGKLTLGTKDSAVYIDGNGDYARTAFDNKGSVIDVHGNLTMKNAVIMNSYNRHGYTGPIRVNSGGTFTMEGGRISKNTSFEQIDQDYTRPYAAGAVYVKPGGTFTMTNGLIDNNHGGLTGGVFAGDLWGSGGDPAVVNIQGGIIANNLSATRFQMGGGLNGFPGSKITITDGIIAGNKSYSAGGGIGISSQYIGSPSNVLGREKASVNTNYENFIKTNKAEAIIDGGLIYKNRALSSGGGIYIDSNDVKLGSTMILDNKSGVFGGGVYASFPPITQKLEDILITENKAKGWYTQKILGGGNGGGLWNCPTGFVHIGDGHSVYVYNNDSGSYGKDITFSEKTTFFQLNGFNLEGEFYSHISPVTKDKNIIKFMEDGPKKDEGVDIPERLSYHRLFTHLKAIYSEALIKEAWKNAKTFVLGNEANNGGGVGSNANITTPKDEGEYAIELNKKWDERIAKKDIPKDIKVDLFIVPTDKDEKYVKANYGKDNSLFKYGEITLSKENNWHSRFDTNYFNGANKEEILKKLGIKNFSDIGLPDGAYQMDHGLPFTAKELEAKGYKYLVVEQGDDFLVKYEEEKPQEEKTEKAGVLEITRKYNAKYDDADVREDKDLYFYVFDPVKQTLTRIGKTTIHEEKDENGTGKGFGKATIAHPLLLKKVSEYKYYGAYRKFTEYEGWGEVEGYHNRDSGYAFVLTENKDGTLTVEVPYLWLNDYYENVGFTALQLDKKADYKLEPKTHSFTLTNYPYSKLDVKKSWTNIKEDDRPDSIDLYLLLDGKRIVEGYDDKGHPIYKKLTLTAKDNWEGSFKKLDPEALSAGKYTLEEDSDIFAPEFIKKEDKFQIRIGYADTLREEGQAENESTSTSGHFKGYNYKNEDGTMKGIKMNLYLDGKKVDTKEFTFTVDYMPEYNLTFYDLKKNVVFKPLEVETYGQAIPVKYYDVISNEPGLYEYNFYLKKDESGAYALYLPRLVINGVPYADLFIAEKLEPNPPYDDHERTTLIDPLSEDGKYQLKVENHYGPTHEIEILKKWMDGGNQIPKEITVIVTDEQGVVQKITITKEDDWKKVLENLKGTLRNKGYSIKEVEIPGFTGDIKTEKAGLKITGMDKNGKSVTLDYMTDELKKVLEKSNYRYEVFTLADEGKNKEFNQENLASFIKLEKQEDGRYIIRYAKGIGLTEVLAVSIKNTYTPPGGTPGSNTRIIRVTKAWDLAGRENPVSEIIVELYRDGQATGKQVKLNADNNWTSSFAGLEIADKANPAKKYQYTIKEVGDVNGLFEYDGKKFDVSYTGNMFTGFTITNKEIPEEPPETPEEPPKTPEEPPVTPPETPEEPPTTPPVTPEEPPVVPQTPPTVPEAPGKAPQTGLPANGAPFLLMAMGLVGLRLTRRRKRSDGQ